MPKFKIEVNKSVCIGCGACASTCPDYFELKGDKSQPKKKEVSDLGCVKEAESVCPVSAIKVTKLK